MRLRWYDDSGNLHVQEAAFDAAGEENAVEVTGMGGLKLYRDSLDYNVGSVLTLEIGHYQGNDEALAINFSQSSRLDYSWTASQLLGGNKAVNLLGETATAKANTGTGEVHLAGSFKGEKSRELFFQVTDGGQVPGDNVTVRVSWTGDDGQSYSQDLTLTGTGLGNAVTVTGCDGVQFYLDSGTYAEGDKFYYKIEKNPISILDDLAEWEYQLANGTTEQAQTQSQKTLDTLRVALQNLLDYVGEAGTRMDRVTVRESVLEDQETYSSENLSKLQDVDLTEAFMNLRAQYTAYGSALQVISVMSELYLANLL
jgi:flagellar hook-associated protein 3 FlgL